MMYRRSASAEGPSSPPPLMLAAPVFEAPVSHSHTHSHPHSGYDLNGHPNSFAYPPSDTHPHTHPHPHPQNQFAHSFSNPLLPHLSQNNNNHHHLQPDSSHNHNHNHHNNNSSSNSSSHAHVDDSLILDALSVLTSSGRIAPPPPQHFTQPEDDISALFAGTSRNNPSHSPTTTSTSAPAATATAPQPTIQQKEPKQKAARQPAQRPKAYAQKACSSCKNSHVACDAGRPCQRCIRLNRADTCEDASRKKRGRPSNAEKERAFVHPPNISLGDPLIPAPVPTVHSSSSVPPDTPAITASADAQKTPIDQILLGPSLKPVNPIKALIASHIGTKQAAAAAAAAAIAALEEDDAFKISPVNADPSNPKPTTTNKKRKQKDPNPSLSDLLDDPSVLASSTSSAGNPSTTTVKQPRKRKVTSAGSSSSTRSIPDPSTLVPQHQQSIPQRIPQYQPPSTSSTTSRAPLPRHEFDFGLSSATDDLDPILLGAQPGGGMSGNDTVVGDFASPPPLELEPPAVLVPPVVVGGRKKMAKSGGEGGGVGNGVNVQTHAEESGASGGGGGSGGLSDILQQLMRGIFSNENGGSGGTGGGDTLTGGAGNAGGVGSMGGGAEGEAGAGENADVMQAVSALSMLLPEELAKALTCSSLGNENEEVTASIEEAAKALLSTLVEIGGSSTDDVNLNNSQSSSSTSTATSIQQEPVKKTRKQSAKKSASMTAVASPTSSATQKRRPSSSMSPASKPAAKKRTASAGAPSRSNLAGQSQLLLPSMIQQQHQQQQYHNLMTGDDLDVPGFSLDSIVVGAGASVGNMTGSSRVGAGGQMVLSLDEFDQMFDQSLFDGIS